MTAFNAAEMLPHVAGKTGDELDEELAEMEIAKLALLPDLIAEVVFSDDEAAAISSALSDDDLAEVGRIFKVARDRYVEELVEDRMLTLDWQSKAEAARGLQVVYS